jgi:uncharacterized protein (TIGR02246 family)
MKNLFMIMSLVCLLCFTFGCQQGEEVAEEATPGIEVDVAADIEAIKKINEEYESAHNAGDINKFVSLFTDDAVRFPAAGPALIGKKAIGDWLPQILDQYTVELKQVLVDFKVSGDLAFYHGTWTTTNTPKGGGEPFKLNGNVIVIMQKQADGAWKIICSGWSNEQLIRPWEEK